MSRSSLLRLVFPDPAPPTVEPVQPDRSPQRLRPPLSPPVDVTETLLRSRAQSILSGHLIGQCPPLTLAQARDVLAWYSPRHT